MNGLILLLAMSGACQSGDQPTIVVVVGVGGEAEYEQRFTDWGRRWEASAEKSGARRIVIGGSEAPSEISDHDRLRQCLAEQVNGGESPLWLVLIGHGTSSGREAKFNLRGDDVSSTELAAWLMPIQRPLAILCCFSSSAPFLPALSSPGRIIVSATRSGNEHFFSRFGDYLSATIVDPSADIDNDGQTSLLEAYLAASSATREFYEQEARLVTEHALLDDNGDGLGTSANWYKGVRATRRTNDRAEPDGARAHQWHLQPSEFERRLPFELRQRRDAVELAMDTHRQQRALLDDDVYYATLEAMLVELAEIYEQAQSAAPTSGENR